MMRITGDGSFGENEGYPIHDFSGDVKAERLTVSLGAEINGDTELTGNVDIGGDISGPYMERLESWSRYSGSSVSIPNNAWTNVDFTTLVGGEDWEVLNDRILPTRPAVFVPTCLIQFSSGFATTHVIGLRIFDRAVNLLGYTAQFAPITSPILSVSGLPAPANGTNDYFFAQAYQNSGSAKTLTATNFSIHAVRT